jgi:hypothetical protein
MYRNRRSIKVEAAVRVLTEVKTFAEDQVLEAIE